LIAGAAGGLGRVMARRFLDEDWRVLGWDRAPVGVEGVEATLVELTDWDAVTTAAIDLPPLHAIVNSAGVASRTPALSLEPSELEAVMRVNVSAAFAVARAGLPAVRRAGGVIINIASVGGHVGFRDRLAYDTSKAALIAMTRHLAIEWASLGVRVISVSPGFVAAGMASEGMASGRTRLEDIVEHTPQGRLVEPEEVAAAVARLTDPAFSAMTGTDVLIDGGFTALGGF
jgi:NAD(P)-dependent dehydrogenase (short-subunit alcohol dehydrogenase family)